jgi:propionyl-CoA carboxylase alpha subunit
VEQMIRVAAGEKLRFAQSDIKLNGWAMEARICAEDPFRNFLPSIGRLVKYAPPDQQPHTVRVDTGVYEGGEISMYYDSMIAKLITHGDTRNEAIARMREALNAFVIRGVSNNIAFQSALFQHPRFISGDFTTAFIGEEYPKGFHPADVAHDDPALLIAVAAAVYRTHLSRAVRISGQLPGHGRKVPTELVVVKGNEHHPVTVQVIEGGHIVTYRDGRYEILSNWRLGELLYRGKCNGTDFVMQVERVGLKFRLLHWGTQAEFLVMNKRIAGLQALMPYKPPPDLSKFLISPMPGLLTEVTVAPGQEVKAGEKLAVIEAMKMENVLKAEQDCVVAEVLAKPGDSLSVDQAIVRFA